MNLVTITVFPPEELGVNCVYHPKNVTGSGVLHLNNYFYIQVFGRIYYSKGLTSQVSNKQQIKIRDKTIFWN